MKQNEPNLLRDVAGIVCMVAVLELAMQLKDPTSELRLRLAELRERLVELKAERDHWRQVAAEMRSDLKEIVEAGREVRS